MKSIAAQVDALVEHLDAQQRQEQLEQELMAIDPLKTMRVAGLSIHERQQKAVDLLTEHQPEHWEQKVAQIRNAMD